VRARNVVLLVDSNPARMSERAYLLETWGYRVWRGHTPNRALEMLAASVPGEVRCLIVELELLGKGKGREQQDGNELVLLAKRMIPGLPAMIVSERGLNRANAGDVFLQGACSPAELLERLRILCIRKRGPRKPAGSVQSCVGGKHDGHKRHNDAA
jgi:two-component system response regulator CpxR